MKECSKCGGLIESGRCGCGKQKKWDGGRYTNSCGSRKPTMAAEHVRFLNKGHSWAPAHRTAINPDADLARAQLYDAMAGGFTIGGARAPIPQNNKGLAWQLYRMEVAAVRAKDEFSGLMLTRLALRLRKFKDAEVCEFLDLTERELRKLDGYIVPTYLARMPRSCYEGPKPKIPGRKLNRGLAREILRRREHNILGQVLSAQVDNPFKRTDEPIYEGRYYDKQTASETNRRD